ncbi:MAG: septal ring lytic transglycosylase RlpA family protein [Thiotrichales bacterium]
MPISILLPLALALTLFAGCATTPKAPKGVDIDSLPDAIPKLEPRSKTGNPESYVQDGVRYWIIPNADGYIEQGKASWYGPKFHGRRTSSGDPYDMYKMTAAHPTLPLPTYARVTNLRNGRSVVVRINDRGPFRKNRAIDLSYAAAYKLRMIEDGTADIEIRVINPAKPQAADMIAKTTPVELPQSNQIEETTESIIEPRTPGISAAPPAATGNPSVRPAENPSSAMIPPAPALPDNRPQTPEVVDQTAPVTATPAPGFYVQVGAFSSLENATRAQQTLQSVAPGNVIISPIESRYKTLQRVQIGPFATREAASRIFPQIVQKGFTQYRVLEINP